MLPRLSSRRRVATSAIFPCRRSWTASLRSSASTATPSPTPPGPPPAVRHFAASLPTYITLKDVKKCWGHGHEDIFPVAQFEKLWSDMPAIHDVPGSFVVVPRPRGQQIKAQAQIDGWLRDGSAAHIEALGDWE